MTDAESFLAAVHARDPGCTARALERARVGAGEGTTYDLVAATARPGDLVLDLGCGDGPLAARLVARGAQVIGVDLSAAELAAARARVPGGAFVRARVQALPLAAACADVAAAHLSLNVIPALDPAIAEIARVLRPGGALVALVGGGPTAGAPPDAYATLASLVAARRPALPRLADPRLRSTRGIAALLAGAFDAVTQGDLDVDLSGAFDDVWAALAAIGYELAALPASDVGDLRAALRARFPGDRVPCALHARLVSAIRR